MMDMLYLALVVFFFAVSWAFVLFADRLMGRSASASVRGPSAEQTREPTRTPDQLGARDRKRRPRASGGGGAPPAHRSKHRFINTRLWIAG